MYPVQIYIFRHGETDWNRERRFQGHTDVPLNQKGREQALELKSHLQRLNPEIILTSDLSRALETAKIASEGMSIPIHISESLREARLGAPEGMLRDEILKKFGEDSWLKWLSVDPKDIDFSYPQGESKREQRDRAVNFILKEIEARAELKSVAISTHGGTMMRLAHHCEGSPSGPIPIPNCSLYHLEFHRREKVWLFHGALNLAVSTDKLFK